jgi:hypothetical protein
MARKGKQVTRRSILRLSGEAFAVAGVAAISGPWPSVRLNRFRLQDVDAESFLPFVGRTLAFERPACDQNFASATTELRLAKVTPHENISRIESHNPAMNGKRKRESFSLLFEQKGGTPLGQGLHRLAHADFEDFQLFLSQVGMPGQDGTIYLEAIFG